MAFLTLGQGRPVSKDLSSSKLLLGGRVLSSILCGHSFWWGSDHYLRRGILLLLERLLISALPGILYSLLLFFHPEPLTFKWMRGVAGRRGWKIMRVPFYTHTHKFVRRAHGLPLQLSCKPGQLLTNTQSVWERESVSECVSKGECKWRTCEWVSVQRRERERECVCVSEWMRESERISVRER